MRPLPHNRVGSKMIAQFRYAAIMSAFLAAAPFAASAETITAASDVGLPPFAFSGDDGKYRGIDMDIAAALSEQIGATIEIIDQPWSTTYPGLNAKKFDIVLSPATVSAERAKAMLFAEPYGDAIYGFLTKKAGTKIATIDDLRGKTIAVNKGNLFDRWLSQREAEYGWTVNRFDKTSDAAAAVAAGQADAAMMYVAAAGWMSKQNGLECLKENGKLAAIFKKWTSLDPLPGGAVVTVAAGYGVPGFPNYDEAPHPLSCK
jgi:polar amino acid transport system substrate-binding protein